MTPIERAARVINPFVWGDGPDREAYQRDALEKARAVLQALREPSEGMIAAGDEAIAYHPEDIICNQAEPCFRAMIDAALTE